jgi:hypothetical protein
VLLFGGTHKEGEAAARSHSRRSRRQGYLCPLLSQNLLRAQSLMNPLENDKQLIQARPVLCLQLFLQ